MTWIFSSSRRNILTTKKVIITSSSDEKLARAKALGADHLINYKKTPDWEVEVLRITQNKGVDIIFETGGIAKNRVRRVLTDIAK